MMTAPRTERPPSARVPRRSFLTWSAAAGGTAAPVRTGIHLGVLPGVGAANAAEATAVPDAVHTTWSACIINCGSAEVDSRTEPGVVVVPGPKTDSNSRFDDGRSPSDHDAGGSGFVAGAGVR